MAMKTKQELKDVFSGLSSIMLVKGGITDFASVEPDFDLPVTVDTLTLSQAEPTLNRTKVHGLQADWAVTSTAGDITFAATVPSMSKELVEYFLGEANDISNATVNGVAYSGFSATLSNKKLNVGFALLSDDAEKCLIVKKMAIYARPLFENASTTPFGFALSGTIEIEVGLYRRIFGRQYRFLDKKSSLTVAPTSLSFSNTADNTGKTITATTKESTVSASSTETWCKTSVSGKVVTVKVTENSGASKRTATVNISTPTEFGQVEVTQEGSTI